MNNKEKMTIWCTKWGLTQGIIKKEAIDLGGGMIRVPGGSAGDLTSLSYYLHGEGVEWHRTEQAALECVIKMAAKKIEALKKQIKKVEAKQAKFRDHLLLKSQLKES